MEQENQELVLKREGKKVSQTDYIKSSNSMRKMQEIMERLVDNTPDIQKFIPQESVLRPNKSQFKTSISDIKDLIQEKKRVLIKPLKPEASANDCIKHVREIESKLEEIKKENEQYKDQLTSKKEIFVKRELDYRKIISGLQDEIRNKALINIMGNKDLEDAAIYHKKILDCISNVQMKTSKILVDQESDILRFFNNKINEIKKQFEEERIKKGKKDQDYIEKESQLIHELDWIKNIAQKIDNENHNLLKKYMDLKAQYQTQENDRQMLLKELIMLKKKNAILKSQIDNFEKILDDVSKDEGTFIQDSPQKQYQNESMNNYEDQQYIPNESNQYKNNYNKSYNQTGNLRFQTPPEQPQNRIEDEIKHVQDLLRKEQKQVRELKNLYMNQLENKTGLERILRKCVDDIKEEIIQLKGENKVVIKNEEDEEQIKQKRELIIDRLLNNEKILTLIYDKTFYSETKNVDNQIVENASQLNEQPQYQEQQQQSFAKYQPKK